LTVSAWNMRSLRCAAPYLNELMSFSDVVAMSEHRLYEAELYQLRQVNKHYEYHAKSSKDLDPGRQPKLAAWSLWSCYLLAQLSESQS
jgi:exonuclease III